MSLRPEQYYRSPSPDELEIFINKRIVPPVDPEKLNVDLVVGDERKKLSTHTAGDMSLVLSYKGKEGQVASFGDEGEVLSILQLQGATRGKGWRVTSGVLVVRLFAAQIKALTEHPEAPYRELFMPPVVLIKGLEDAVSGLVSARYEGLACELGMRYSQEERRFVKKIK